MQLVTRCEPLFCPQCNVSADLPGYIITQFDDLFKTAQFNSPNLIDFKNDSHIVFETLNE